MEKLERLAFTLWSKCNGKCGYCFNKGRQEGTPILSHKDEIELEKFLVILQQAIPLGLKVVELSGGEPFLQPDKTIRMAHEAKNLRFVTGLTLLIK